MLTDNSLLSIKHFLKETNSNSLNSIHKAFQIADEYRKYLHLFLKGKVRKYDVKRSRISLHIKYFDNRIDFTPEL